jgi:hypothetical protein
MTSERKGTSCLNSALLEYLQHMCRLESSVASPKTNQLKAGHATWDKSVVMSDAFCFLSLFCTIPSAPLGLVRFRGIQSCRNNKCMKKIMIWTRIYSGSKINLSIMMGRTRDRRGGLVSHLLTNGLIPSLLVYLS